MRKGYTKEHGSRPWTPEEDATMRECYPKYGATWEGYETLLPDRSLQAIRIRARNLRLTYDGPCKAHPDCGEDKYFDRAAAAVAALDDEQRENLALLMMNANAKRVIE